MSKAEAADRRPASESAPVSSRSDASRPAAGKCHTAFLSAGSNLGDRRKNLEQGLAMLERAGVRIKRRSSFFETEPVGHLDQPWFLNLAVEIETSLDPEALLQCCQAVEAAAGRDRPFPGAPRTLDLDILLYGEDVVSNGCLTIPHPRMAGRRFVLEPLAEIAPDAFHPVLRKSVRSLLQCCTDMSSVQIHSPGDAE